MSKKSPPALGFTTRQVCDLAGVAPSTLNAWTKGEALVEPSLLPSEGKRSDRFWSVQDLVTVRCIKALRQSGCPLQQLRRARAEITRVWETELSSMVLFWDGSDLVAADAWGAMQSLIRHPGQQMLHVVAVPLAEWREDARERAQPVDIAAIRKRRDDRAGRNRAPQASVGFARPTG